MIFDEERMSSDNAWRAWKVVDDNSMGEWVWVDRVSERECRVDRASERECRVDRDIVRVVPTQKPRAGPTHPSM
jgi:hypothetical protein